MKKFLSNFVRSLFNDLLWLFEKINKVINISRPSGGGVIDNLPLNNQAKALSTKPKTNPKSRVFLSFGSFSFFSAGQVNKSALRARAEGLALSKTVTPFNASKQEKENEHKANKINKRSYLINKKSFAFTLSELLMSVLVVSIILVAMAPVITKRTSDNISVNAIKYEGKLYTFSFSNPDCQRKIGEAETKGLVAAAMEEGFVECAFEIPRGVNNVNIVSISGGGGGGGAANSLVNNKKISNSPEDSGNDPTKSISETVTIESYMKDFKLDYLRSAGGAGGGAVYFKADSRPSSKRDCSKISAFDPVNKICIFKKNIGDFTSANKAKLTELGIQFIDAEDETGCTDPNKLCCFTGNTADPDNCSRPSSNSGWYKYGSGIPSYLPCNRTVCTVPAGKLACENYPFDDGKMVGLWRMPNTDEIENLRKTAVSEVVRKEDASNLIRWVNFAAGGIELCDGNSSEFGTSMCGQRKDLCKIAGNTLNYCRPNFIASGELLSNSNYLVLGLLYGSGTSADGYTTSPGVSGVDSAYSIRCVLDNLGDRTGISTGGGGAGGNVISDWQIPKDFLEVGGSITVTAPKRCTGGETKYKEKAGDGQCSNISNARFKIKNASNKNKFSIVLLHGNCGTGATKTIPGDPGINSAENEASVGYGSNVCSVNINESDNSVYYLPNCANYGVNPIIGKDGYRGEATNDYNDWIERAGYFSEGGSSKFPNDSNIWLTTGGEGGSIIMDETATTVEDVYNGGDGYAGQYALSWKEIFPATGGVGGQGGAFFKVENFEVEEGHEFIVRVGKGGIGGQAGEDGKNGGISGFSYEGKSLFVAGGAGGKHGIKGSSKDALNAPIMGNGAFPAGTNIQASQGYSYSTNYAEEAKNVAQSLENKSATSTSFEEITVGEFKITLGENGAGFTNLLSSLFYDAALGWLNWGTSGGASGVYSLGGCGGYIGYNLEKGACVSADSDISQSKNGTSAPFTLAGENSIIMGVYGAAGAGGGGGGWSGDVYNTAGKGGDGQNGYVYVYWTKVDRQD